MCLPRLAHSYVLKVNEGHVPDACCGNSAGVYVTYTRISEIPFLFIFRELRCSRRSLKEFEVNNIRALALSSRHPDYIRNDIAILRREERRERDKFAVLQDTRKGHGGQADRNHRAQISAVILKRPRAIITRTQITLI